MPKWTLFKTFRFEAAHVLPKHQGKCARLHGHSWHMTVELEADTLYADGPSSGMVADFGRISEFTAPLVDGKLDHRFLNESLNMADPTSEEVARFCFDWLTEHWPTDLSVALKSVRIEETCTSACEYRP